MSHETGKPRQQACLGMARHGQAGPATSDGRGDASPGLRRVGLPALIGGFGVLGVLGRGLGPWSQVHGGRAAHRAVFGRMSHWWAWERSAARGSGVHQTRAPGQHCSFAWVGPYLQGNLYRQTQPGVGLGLLSWCYTHHLAHVRIPDRWDWQGPDMATDSPDCLVAHRSQSHRLGRRARPQ
jgi:hypothetical protein